jgi:hypothetical protein
MAKPKSKPKDMTPMGRPPVADEHKRSTHIKMRCTEAEQAEIENAAAEAGMQTSTWMRLVCLERARSGAK